MPPALFPLPEPVPHPALSSPPTPLLRALLGETPSRFRALLFGPEPATGRDLAERIAALSLPAEQRRLHDLARTAPRRGERHRAARLARVLQALLERGAPALFLAAVPILDEAFLADLPGGLALARLQRDVTTAAAALTADPTSAAARVRLRRAVFAHAAAAQRWRAHHDPLHPDPARPRRVDFSATATVVPDPALPLDHCAIPLDLAFPLFALHLAGDLVRRGLAPSPAAARAVVAARPAWLTPLLAALVADHPVLLSAPGGVARTSVQAFFPQLTADPALHLSPAAILRLVPRPEAPVVKVFLPLGERAREEACQRLTSPATVLGPDLDAPWLALSADAVVGVFLASLPRAGAAGSAPLPGPRAAWEALEPGRSLGPAERAALQRLQRAQLEGGGVLRGFFASLAEVDRALEAGALAPGAHVFVRHRGVTLATVAGRCAVMALLPPELDAGPANQVLDRPALLALLAEAVRVTGAARAARLAEDLEALGLRLVTARGVSLASDDLAAPPGKAALLERGLRDQAEVARLWDGGEVTDGERYHQIVDLWAEVAARVADDLRLDPRRVGAETRPLQLLVASGAAGGWREVTAIAGMKGIPTKPSGEMHEAAITASFAEGLGPHGAFASAAQVRATLGRAPGRAREDRRLARLLLGALGAVRVTARDCGALGALDLGDLGEVGGPTLALPERVRGKVRVDDTRAVRRASVRSPVFCEAERGVCAACYGAASGTGALPELGTPVGIHAAHALTTRLDRLHERLFHICMCAAVYAGPEGFEPGGLRGASPEREAPADGRIVIRPEDPTAIAVTPAGDHVVMLAGLEILVASETEGLLPAAFPPRGAHLRVGAGERVRRGQVIADWDHFHIPVLAEHDGVVRWEDLREGQTLRQGVDEVTGLERAVVLEAAGSPLRPRLLVVSAEGALLQTVVLEAEQHLRVPDGGRVSRGEVLARLPVPSKVVPDVRHGRSDFVNVLDGETPYRALLAEISGHVSVVIEPDRSRTVTVRPTEGSPEAIAAGTRSYRVPRGRDVLVQEGDFILAGEWIHAGVTDLGDLGRVLGPACAAREIVDRVQLVFALATVPLDLRHAELVARALLRFVRVRDPGDGPWAEGELVPRGRYARVCAALAESGRRAPAAELAVTGLGRRGARALPPSLASR
jgi:DNA-directed RNA polymerase subunit beta'